MVYKTSGFIWLFVRTTGRLCAADGLRLRCDLGCLGPENKGLFPPEVQKPHDDDGEMDKPESDNEDEVEQVGGGGGLRRAPRRSDKRPKTMGIVTSILSTPKWGRPRARTQPPGKSSLRCDVTTCVSMNVLCWVHGSLCDGHVSNRCHFSYFENPGSCSAQTRRIDIFFAFHGHSSYGLCCPLFFSPYLGGTYDQDLLACSYGAYCYLASHTVTLTCLVGFTRK